MQQTPLAKLIDKLEEKKAMFPNQTAAHREIRKTYTAAILVAKSLQKEEKINYQNSWIHGWNDRGNDDGDFSQHKDAAHFFKENYTQKPGGNAEG